MAWYDFLGAVSPAYLAGRGVTSGYAKPILGTAGAVGGAALGSLVGAPGVGASLGAGLGASAGSATDSYFNPQQGAGNGPNGNALTGYDAYNTQLSNRNPLQQNAMDQLVQQGLANSNFQGIEDLARKNLATKTVPLLAERFAAFGGSGTRTSGGFEHKLSQAGPELEAQLAALRGQYGMNQLQLGLQPQYENIYTPQQGGFAQSFAQDVPKYAELLADLYSQYQKNKLGGGS